MISFFRMFVNVVRTFVPPLKGSCFIFLWYLRDFAGQGITVWQMVLSEMAEVH